MFPTSHQCFSSSLPLSLKINKILKKKSLSVSLDEDKKNKQKHNVCPHSQYSTISPILSEHPITLLDKILMTIQENSLTTKIVCLN